MQVPIVCGVAEKRGSVICKNNLLTLFGRNFQQEEFIAGLLRLFPLSRGNAGRYTRELAKIGLENKIRRRFHLPCRGTRGRGGAVGFLTGSRSLAFPRAPLLGPEPPPQITPGPGALSPRCRRGAAEERRAPGPAKRTGDLLLGAAGGRSRGSGAPKLGTEAPKLGTGTPGCGEQRGEPGTRSIPAASPQPEQGTGAARCAPRTPRAAPVFSQNLRGFFWVGTVMGTPNFELDSPPSAPSVDGFSSPRGPLLLLPCRPGRARFPPQRKHAGVWAGRPAAAPTPHSSRRGGDARPGGLLAAELRAGGARPSPRPWGRCCGAQRALGRTHGCPGSGHPRWVRDQRVGAGAAGSDTAPCEGTGGVGIYRNRRHPRG